MSTWVLEKMLIKAVLRGYECRDYTFFDDGKNPYNVNIVGIRNDEARADYFDDTILVICRRVAGGDLRVKAWPATTDPGLTYAKHRFGAAAGTAILVPGQYRGVYKIDRHGRGRASEHEALCQRNGSVKVWRDKTLDAVHDFGAAAMQEGSFGINIHRSSLRNKGNEDETIGPWSAGCQVFQRKTDFDEFMGLCRQARKRYGNSFTYTLLTQEDMGIEV